MTDAHQADLRHLVRSIIEYTLRQFDIETRQNETIEDLTEEICHQFMMDATRDQTVPQRRLQ